MRLITHHPLKLGMFSFRDDRDLDDLLNNLRANNANLYISLAETTSTEFMSTLYPQKLVIMGLESSLTLDSRDIEIWLEVFSGGQANLVVEVNVHKNQLERDALIEFVDEKVRSELCANLLQTKLLISIAEHFKDLRYPKTVSKELDLMYAYSQILIADSDEEWESMAPIRGMTETARVDCGCLSVDASFICLRLDDSSKASYYCEMLATVTLFTAMAYELQQQGLQVSRKILNSNVLVENDYAELQKYMHWVDVCEQFQVELRQEDFLATSDEQQIARTVADNWLYSDLCSRVGAVVGSLANHVRSIETKRSLRNQDRANLIFLAFTLISILSVSGDLLALYDIGDKILPLLRLGIVTATFAIVSITTVLYLKRR